MTRRTPSASVRRLSITDVDADADGLGAASLYLGDGGAEARLVDVCEHDAHPALGRM